MKTTSQAEDFGFVGRSLPIPGLAKKSYGLVLSSKENYLKKSKIYALAIWLKLNRRKTYFKRH